MFSQGTMGGTGNAPIASAGEQLPIIQTDDLGFVAIAGDARIRLTNPWPQQPASSASLLSIASKRGLAAAAGPDYIVFASTESIRKAFEAPKEGDSHIRSYEPQLKISMPMRISQVAFTADENYLILSAESGGGMAVYEVQSLLQGSNNSAFELPTNGESLRALVPNPTAEKAELCAIVTQSGELFMANLRERRLSSSLKSQVTCISWSAKGKQLCAGLADGSIYQMTPEGQGKAEIPKPPTLGNCHGDSPHSQFHIITREPPSSFQFRGITDPIDSFGEEKVSHHAILRLRNFDPDLQDLLMVCSSASAEVGLLTRSKKPLANIQAADQITEIFTTTEIADETRLPVLPMTESLDESVAFGVALDLSSKKKVYRPIPSDDELEESPSPLPGLWVLTQEGILSAWWLVYNDSIKQGTTYSGLAIASDSTSLPPPAQPTSTTPTASPLAPGKLSFGSPSSAAPAFGSSSQLGQKTSPWASMGGATTSSPARTGGAIFGRGSFGDTPPTSTPAPTFGRPSSIGFGQSSQLGIRTSPWAAGGNSAAPAFGQPSFSQFTNKNNQASFGTPLAADNKSSSPEAPATKGFSSFAANNNGFASASNNNGASVFSNGGAAKPASNPFATNSTPAADNPFAPKEKSTTSVFGSTPFKLESSFKPDPLARDDVRESAAPSGAMFGNAFGSALTNAAIGNDSSNTAAKDADMVDDDANSKEQEPPKSIFSIKPAEESTTPASTPAPARFGTSVSTTPGTSLFGQPTKLGAPFSGGSFFAAKTDVSDSKPASSFLSQSEAKTKQFPEKEQSFKTESEEPDAPLPPDTTSKASYPLGESSSSSVTSSSASQPVGLISSTQTGAAPLPPSPPGSSMSKAGDDKTAEDAPLPPFFLGQKDSKSAEAASPSSVAMAKTAMSATDAPLPPFASLQKTPSAENVPLPSFENESASNDQISTSKTAKSTESAPLPSFSKAPEWAKSADIFTNSSVFKSIKQTGPTPAFVVPDGPLPSDSEDDSDFDEEEEEVDEDAEDADDLKSVENDEGSEGSGIDVANDMSTSTVELVQTPGLTPQSSFLSRVSTTPATARPVGKNLFGEVGRSTSTLGKPTKMANLRSLSPVRGVIPNRAVRSKEASRSVSAPGVASQSHGFKSTRSHLTQSIISHQQDSNDAFLPQQRKLREQQRAAETKPLVDEEDDEIQKILVSEVQGSVELDEFIAHSNVAPPAEDSIPAQVEAVYRDINAMIDTLGLNGRAIKSFIKGHTEARNDKQRSMEDLEIADDWVLCEIDDLGEVLSRELHPDLEAARVKDLPKRLEACQELAKDMHRLRAKQEDLKRVMLARMEPDQANVNKSLPLSAEQAAQQNELRREFTKFTKLLAETEEALTLLKARIASVSGASGKGGGNVPTVDAVIRTISKMTGMVEKRSGDVDVLEMQLRRMKLGSVSREGSPMMTPKSRRGRNFSPDTTPSRTLRQNMLSNGAGLGQSVRATPPRKKLSGFSEEEKSDLMDKRAKRLAVIEKIKGSVEKRGVNVWNMEDAE